MGMKNSSNTNMKRVFEDLADIKKAEPNADLYVRTLNRLQHKNIIPLLWVRAVACLLIVFVATEYFITLKYDTQHKEDISNLIYRTKSIIQGCKSLTEAGKRLKI